MSSFKAKDLLEKHGWTEGSGLGRREHGMKEALKVNIKADTAGIGHDAGAVYTFHWWDHVYNSAADSINVVSDGEGVRVSKLGEYELTVKKKQAKLANRNLLYGRFVKSATLHNDGAEVKEPLDKSDSDSSDSDADDKGTVSKITDDELFKKLGGLTAHKAARHGHRLNGKLERLKQQELLSMTDRTPVQQGSAPSDHQETRKKKRKRDKENLKMEAVANNTIDLTSGHMIQEDDTVICDSSVIALVNDSPNNKSELQDVCTSKNNHKEPHKKKKKSKMEKNMSEVESASLNDSKLKYHIDINLSNYNLAEKIDSRKRNKKRKRQSSPSLENILQIENIESSIIAEVSDILEISSDIKPEKKKRKKNKKSKVNISEEIKVINVDSGDEKLSSRTSKEQKSIEHSSPNECDIVKKKKKSKKAKL